MQIISITQNLQQNCHFLKLALKPFGQFLKAFK